MDERDLNRRPIEGQGYGSPSVDRSFYDRTAYERGVIDRGPVPEREVDIRRTAVLGREQGHFVAVAPMHKALRWGPIFAGLATSIVASLLIGSLFLGLGFDGSYGAFGGVTAEQAGWGTSVALLLAVFLGSMVTGYVSDLRSKAEGVMNGFMVGIMAILTPLVVGVMGGTVAGSAAATNLPDTTNAPGAAAVIGNNIAAAVPPAVENQVRSALVVAADNAWFVFAVGVLILAVSSLGGYLGSKSREKGLEADARRDLERATTY